MEPLRKKWNSQRGASILLALLLLLVCVMVAASVLMAAASSAGKSRSGREEQQKYLTLSSALALVSDQLTQSEYRGKYTYRVEEKFRWEGSLEDGSWVHDYWQHTYTQLPGDLQCGLNEAPAFILPLFNDLDHYFAQRFHKADSVDHRYQCISLPGVNTTVKNPYTLELTVDAGSEGEEAPWLTQPVSVTVTWNAASGHLYLRAALEEKDEGGNLLHTYAMEAELKAVKAPGSVLRLADDPAPGEAEYYTEPMTWELNWIVKK